MHLPALTVNEVFYSLQGEGARAGHPSIFIRLTGCSAKEICRVACDTEFESGRAMTCAQIHDRISTLAPACHWIVWTGGEPTDQLKSEHVEFFKQKGYKQAIETSGIRPVPPGLDWVTCSPKVAEHILKRNFPEGVTELKYVYHENKMGLPQPQIMAQYFFLSPQFDGAIPNEKSIQNCIRLCLENPEWKMTIQLHKLLSIL